MGGSKAPSSVARVEKPDLLQVESSVADQQPEQQAAPELLGIRFKIFAAHAHGLEQLEVVDHIVILSEMIHYARIIRLDSEHSTRQLKWGGDSVAHWEGDTLVINTEHFYYDTGWRGTSASLKVEERISWVDENTLSYDFTVEDPLSWDVSWSGKLPMRRIEDPIYEYACHEGNHGLPGILAGWRRYESMGMNGDGTAKAED